MIRKSLLMAACVLIGLATVVMFSGCNSFLATPPDGAAAGSADDDTTDPADDTDTTPPDDPNTVTGVLQVKALAESLSDAAHIVPSGQAVPDDVDVNLTPTAYTVAFMRIVLKQVDETTAETLNQFELFSADGIDDALVVDLLDTAASDVLDVEDLPAGAYNQVDIEVFYLDMTVPTIYPGTESYEIPYRMVFEQMGALEPRDFLLYLEPSWMEAGSELAASVTEAGWYWMEMSDPDHVVPVAGAVTHPEFHVLDLFADDEFWSSEHKVLEGGRINPPLEYDPEEGGVLTIAFDVTGKFNFKDYYDETTEPDGQWEIRLDAGIHPFPPDFNCVPEAVESL
jgi:hypothetical protein